MSFTGSASSEVESQDGATASRKAGYEVSQRLLSATTAPDALSAVVDAIGGSADFCLVLEMGRVPGADVAITAAWSATDGGVSAQRTALPYAWVAPFFRVAQPATDLAVGHGILETVVVNDIARDGRMTPQFRQLLARARAGSFVAVPMNFEGQTHAVFVAGRAGPSRFEPRLVHHYEMIAGQLEGALRNLVLLEQSQTRAAQLEVVAEISGAASSILDLEKLLPLAVELIRERFHLYYVGIFLLDVERQRVALRAGTGAAGQEMVEAGHHFAVGEESMIGWCAANRAPRIALDVGREAVRFDNPLLPETRSEMALPLLTRGRLVGAMSIQSTAQAAFTAGDVTVLQVLADQLAGAIENARSFQERERRMTQMAVVNEIGQALSTGLDLSVLFALVHQQVGRLFDARDFYIAVYEEGREFWELAYSVEEGRPQPPTRHSVRSGLTGWILRHRMPILFRTARESTVFHELEGIPTIGPKSRSWLGVPLIVSQKLVGAMGIEDYEQEYLYDESDKALFEVIGGQVAAVLDNAKLLAETEERARQMEVINEVGSVVTSVLDVDEVLRRVVDVTKERFGYYCVSIALVSEAGIEIKYGSKIGDTDRRFNAPGLVLEVDTEELSRSSSRVRARPGLVAECARTGQPVVVGDVLNDPRYLLLEDLPDTRSELVVPIVTKGRVIGVLDVQSDRSFAFDDTDIVVLQQLASQAGTAIENARLFEQEQARAQEQATLRLTVETVSRSLDMHTMLHTALEQVLTALNLDAGLVSLYDQAAGHLVLSAHQSVPDPMVRTFEAKGLGGTLCDYVYKTGQSISIGDIRKESPVNVDRVIENGLVAYAGTLLTGRGERLGTMCFFHRTVRSVKDAELALLEAIGGQVGLGVANIRLFEEAEMRAKELAVLNEMGRSLAARLDVSEVIQNIYRFVSRLMDVHNFYIALHDPETGEVSFPLAIDDTDQTGWGARRGGKGLTEYVIRSGEALLIERDVFGYIESSLRGVEPTGHNAQSWLGAPMRIGAQILGVIAVQSYDTPNLYTDRHRELLVAMASQAAIALQNARLLEETRAALEEVEEVHRSYVRRGWEQHLRQSRMLGQSTLVYEGGAIRQVASSTPRPPTRSHEQSRNSAPERAQEEVAGSQVDSQSDTARQIVTVPIMLRGQKLGEIGVEVPVREVPEAAAEGHSPWTDDDYAVLEAVGEQLGQTLESARLFADTQRLAERERLVGEISAKIRASTDMRDILETTAVELGRVLGTSRALVRLTTNVAEDDAAWREDGGTDGLP